MRKYCFLFVVVTVCALSVHAAEPRTLTRTVAAEQLAKIDLNSGVGDVEIIGREGGDQVMVDVVLTLPLCRSAESVPGRETVSAVQGDVPDGR